MREGFEAAGDVVAELFAGGEAGELAAGVHAFEDAKGLTQVIQLGNAVACMLGHASEVVMRICQVEARLVAVKVSGE